MQRPSVSVVVPFAGSDEELADVCAWAGSLGAEEVFVADNRPGAVDRGIVVGAGERRSSYFARDAGAARCTSDWILFLDADCSPPPDLLDAYFAAPVPDDVAVLAGGIVDFARGSTVVERYIAARSKLAQDTTLAHPRGPYAQTANALVRRSAFEAAGGFGAPVFSGGDADLCWRLQVAGGRLESRPGAVVRHLNRSTLRALLSQMHRHGSGMQWLDTRYPGAFPPPRPRELLGRLRMLLSPDQPFAAIDVLALFARDAGRLRANGDPTPW